MRILDRYLLTRLIWAIIYCLLFFAILFVVIDVFNNLDVFIQHKAPLAIMASYYFYLLASVLVQIIPVAVLVATLYTLGNLTRHNEIVAIKVSGVSTPQILFPYLFAGMILSLFLLFSNETFVPSSSITASSIMDGLIKADKTDLKERSIKNVALCSEKNLMIFAREYEVLTQTLHDVVVLENNPENQALKSKLTAKKAQYENENWTFYDTIRYKLDQNGEIIGQPIIAKKTQLWLNAKPEDFIKEISQMEFMGIKELKSYGEKLKGSNKKMLRRLWVEFHYKIAFPFIGFVVLLIAIPLAMKQQRGGGMVGIGTSLVIALLYYGFNSICLALGKGGFLPPILAAWLGNILFGVAGIYLIKHTP